MAESISEVRVYTDTYRTFQGGKKFDRYQHINLHYAPHWIKGHWPIEEEYDLAFEYDFGFGRNIDMCFPTLNQHRPMRESSAKPGFISEEWIKMIGVDAPHPQNSDLEAKFSKGFGLAGTVYQTKFPHFMKLWEHEGRKYFPENHAAAADLIAKFIKHVSLPEYKSTYFEPINEPSWRIVDRPEFYDYLRAYKKAFQEHELNIKVGGPCRSIAYFYRGNYKTYWQNSLVPFMENLWDDMDFFSFHVYDYYKDGESDVVKGLPLEGVLDLYESYCLANHDKVKPLVISEHGCTGADFLHAIVRPSDAKSINSGKLHSREQMDFWTMNSINGQLMTFLNRSDVVEKSVPFISLKAIDKRIRAPWQLYTKKGFNTKADYYATDLHKFYQFWKGVKGDRLLCISPDPDLQTAAFVNEKTIITCINNLSSQAKKIQFSKPLSGATITLTRLYEKEAKSVLEKVTVELLNELDLKPDEIVKIETLLDKEPEILHAVEEKRYFSKDTILPIKKNEPITTKVNIPTLNKLAYAKLRIGISRPLSKTDSPEVKFNGNKLDLIKPLADEKQKQSQEFSTCLIAEIPFEFIKQNDNILRISYSTDGGTIGAIALILGEYQK